MVSYAQNYEDVMLRRALKDIPQGFYVDVGAAWPDQDSVTKYFYGVGWTGINIEPNTNFFEKLDKDRPKDINLCLAVSDTCGVQEFTQIDGTGLSTLDNLIASKHASEGWSLNKKQVTVATLNKILEKYLPLEQEIHFLKIDVEGLEKNVIQSNDWERYRPWIVLVESTLPLSQIESHSEWEENLISFGYIFVYNDGLNRFYISVEKKYLASNFKTPPNVFDDFLSDTEYQVEQKLKDTLLELNQRALDVKKAYEIIEGYEKSLSWKLTKPLRVSKSITRIGVQKLNRSLNPFLYSYINNHPQVKQKLKRLYFLVFRNIFSKEPFIKMQMNNYNLYFSSAALVDHRGIGRVSREILNEFQKLSVVEGETKINEDVYFYSSIHWCPKLLPPNSIIMIHDVIPLIFPEKFKETNDRWLRDFKKIANQAKQILTISHSSAKDISRLLDIPASKIQVVYNGVSELPVALKLNIELPEMPYIAILGSNDPHKNLEIALESMLDPSISNISLVCIGDPKGLKESVRTLGLEKRVYILGRLPDEEVGFILKNSLVLVFPSLYEGFGLPPLEAALLGTPSICSKRPAMTEILDGACLFADPYNKSEWVEAIKMLRDNPTRRQEIATSAKLKAKSFGWSQTALKIDSVISHDLV